MATFTLNIDLAGFDLAAKAGVKVRLYPSVQASADGGTLLIDRVDVETAVDGTAEVDLVTVADLAYTAHVPGIPPITFLAGSAGSTVVLASVAQIGTPPTPSQMTTLTARVGEAEADVDALEVDVATKADAAGTTAALATKIPSSEKGAPSGVATLGADTLVPQAQLPAHLTTTSLSSTYARDAYFKRAEGSGTYTLGDVLKLGSHAYNTRADVGTGLVAGGAPNYENVVGGNIANVNTSTSNLTGAAALTGQDGNWAFVLSGYDNVVNGWATVCNGFHQKVNAGSNHVTIGGGSMHTVNASIAYVTIGGGTTNTVTGNNAVIAGGSNNTAGAQGTVAGGNINAASGSNSSIGGGNSNTASGNNAAIGGGTNNTASGASATVAGGQFNVASATASTAWGRENTAAAAASTAMGRDVSIPSNLDHAVGHGAGKFATAGDAQVLRLVAKRQTTDGTPAALRIDSAGTSVPLTVPADTVWAFRALIAARNTGANEGAAYQVTGCIKRDTSSASTTALVGTPVVTVLGEDTGATLWDVAATASTSLGSLEFTVTGEVLKTIRWVGSIEITSVTG